MNVVNIQTMLDGARNYVAKVDVALDGSGDISNPYTIVDPRLLSSMGPGSSTLPPSKVRVDLLDWDFQDGIAAYLWWEGPMGDANTPIWRMVGRSIEKAFHVGGLQNNADQATGRITLTTASLTLGVPLVGTFKIHCVKQT